MWLLLWIICHPLHKSAYRLGWMLIMKVRTGWFIYAELIPLWVWKKWNKHESVISRFSFFFLMKKYQGCRNGSVYKVISTQVWGPYFWSLYPHESWVWLYVHGTLVLGILRTYWLANLVTRVRSRFSEKSCLRNEEGKP